MNPQGSSTPFWTKIYIINKWTENEGQTCASCDLKIRDFPTKRSRHVVPINHAPTACWRWPRLGMAQTHPLILSCVQRWILTTHAECIYLIILYSSCRAAYWYTITPGEHRNCTALPPDCMLWGCRALISEPLRRRENFPVPWNWTCSLLCVYSTSNSRTQSNFHLRSKGLRV